MLFLSSLCYALLTIVITGLLWFIYAYINRFGPARYDAVHYSGKKHLRCVIIGASFAGLLMARALSDFFEEVILLEKDDLPALEYKRVEVTRAGVPQARIGHILLCQGKEVSE